MADVVGKTIFSDGKGKLFFGYYKTDDGVQFVDYKTWKKLSFKDVSKGDTNKERVIKAILKNQKQFNKKVEFNMWAKQKKRTFEETMDWFIQNGWINNINKGGIKESVDVLSVNESQFKDLQIGDEFLRFGENGQLWKKTSNKQAEFIKNVGKKTAKYNKKPGSLDVFPPTMDITLYESVNEGKKRFKQQDGIGSSKYTISYHDGKKKNKDGSDFFDIKIFKNKPELEAFKKDLVSKGFVKESVNEAKFGYTDSTASYINKHNNEYKIAEKMNKGNEQKFYDDLQAMEDKIGHSKTMKFISNALRGYKVDMFKDPKIKNPADAQEALFLLSK